MEPMSEAEFWSTDTEEMSVFQGLASGKGRNPFKLPCKPVAIALHGTGGVADAIDAATPTKNRSIRQTARSRSGERKTCRISIPNWGSYADYSIQLGPKSV
jgi:hypothetical protein